MEHNKSLSARIRRRNKCGFVGVGTGLGFNPANKQYGDYTDSEQNHKDIDYKIAKSRKDRVGMKSVIAYNSVPFTLHKRALNKKFADNHQKATK